MNETPVPSIIAVISTVNGGLFTLTETAKDSHFVSLFLKLWPLISTVIRRD